ncbi:anaerobic ribonucleoside-triphosphate reductase activating protein [Zobellella endophytica]|uniref:Anaerobic ribonucleoside-triphosphate reductase activating protein n=1 Tax=Zobellella endophytica TaxID=2116700 RepID=A0A2P7RBH5_9GAMM|nr:anaerobic ribonucleoside-triphosphate reductase activating protein [Zobellella endophytica]PSJ47577.1 anaerobic ribonucleoside-triphosphate reductase activating protein [Zobellella endophytica]
MLNAFEPRVVLQEVPGEVSLAWLVTGCPQACPGCHSRDSWDPQAGSPLTLNRLQWWLERYRGLLTCVLFFGGEWDRETLLVLLRHVRRQGLKTCLYSGRERVGQGLIAELDYLKTGPWRAELGGLDSRDTNQRLICLSTGESLNHHFWRPL